MIAESLFILSGLYLIAASIFRLAKVIEGNIESRKMENMGIRRVIKGEK